MVAWRLTTQRPLSSRTPCIQRRSGRHASRSVRCSRIAGPRTRIALQPPPLAFSTSGLRTEIALRRHSSRVAGGQHQARVGAARARQQRRPPRRHLLEQRDVPRPAVEPGGELVQQPAPRRRDRAPVEEVPGQHAHVRGDRTLPPLPTPLPHRRRALAGAARPRSSTARSRSSRRPPGRARWRAAPSRCCSSSPRPARARRRRPASSSSAATRWSCAPTSCSSRAGSRCATPRSCSPATSPRSACGPSSDERLERARRARHGAGGQPALAAAPPVPGARRPDDAARGVRRDRGPQAGLRRRRQQRRALARDRRRAGRRRGRGRRAGGLPAAGGARRAADRRPGRGGRRRRRDLRRRLGLDERRRRGGRARREALAPYRLDDALLDRAAPGAIALHCLPAHPGEEITEAVLYGDRQRIWDQAENRRHVFKALLEFLVAG